MKVKNVEGPSINSMYVAVEAYLDGKISCEETVSKLKDSELPADKLAGIMRQLSDYGDKGRYSLICKECKLFGVY